jgi:CO/xanthine dehydrogenase Mo-binding subunit
MEAVAREVGWNAIGKGRLSPCGTRRRGRGLAAMIYPVGFTATNNPSAAFARVNEDATLTLWSGVVDMGQGAHTILRQIAAEEMGVPLEAVQIISGDSDIAPLDLGSVASRVTHIAGNAVLRAVGKVKAQLARKAGEMLEASEKDIKIEDSTAFVEAAPERSLPLSEVALKCHKDGEIIIG